MVQPARDERNDDFGIAGGQWRDMIGLAAQDQIGHTLFLARMAAKRDAGDRVDGEFDDVRSLDHGLVGTASILLSGMVEMALALRCDAPFAEEIAGTSLTSKRTFRMAAVARDEGSVVAAA